MDALAGYGSDTDSSDDDRVGGVGDDAIGTVLAASFDDDRKDGVAVTNGHGIGDVDPNNNDHGCRDGTTITTTKINGNDGCEKDVNGNNQGSICLEITTRIRRRRWDDPGEKQNDEDKSALVSLLPPPELSIDGSEKGTDPFRLLGLFPRDCTTRLREDLSRQMRMQLERSTKDKDDRLKRLNEKLDRLYDRFQGGTTTDATLSNAHGVTASPSSFSAHLKSQRDFEFGNPALIHNIIDHFKINPLGSHGGNTFKRFEYADRLMAAGERARVAQASNYDTIG